MRTPSFDRRVHRSIRVAEELIPSALADQRLDRVVSIIADVSRSVAAALIDAGAVTVDGEVWGSGKVMLKHCHPG